MPKEQQASARRPLLRSKALRWASAAVILVAAYSTAYKMAPRIPAANMAYFVYSDNDRVNTFCYYFFMPAYLINKHAYELLDQPFSRYNSDRELIIYTGP